MPHRINRFCPRSKLFPRVNSSFFIIVPLRPDFHSAIARLHLIHLHEDIPSLPCKVNCSPISPTCNTRKERINTLKRRESGVKSEGIL